MNEKREKIIDYCVTIFVVLFILLGCYAAYMNDNYKPKHKPQPRLHIIVTYDVTDKAFGVVMSQEIK